MRRSSRVVKRKKYVDDLDLNLSDDNSNDDEKPDQAITVDECDRLATPSLSADVYEVRISQIVTFHSNSFLKNILAVLVSFFHHEKVLVSNNGKSDVLGD